MRERLGRGSAIALGLVCLTLTAVPSLQLLAEELRELDSERRLYLQMQKASRGLPPVLVGLRSEWSEACRFNRIVYGPARADHAYTHERFASIVE